jgi:hypothetical protein
MRYTIEIMTKCRCLGTFALCICLTNCTNLIDNQAKSFNPPLKLISSDVAAIAQPSNGDMTLRVPVLDSQVVLKTRAEFSGAISSLVFRGKEHIDRHDTGRLLQSASQFEGYGECFNPTEGGARGNKENPKGLLGSSKLKKAYIGKNQIWTLTDMAFWTPPGEAYPQGCGVHPRTG